MKSWGPAMGVAALVVGGCMSASMGTGLVQLSSDTYRLSRIDGVGRYPDAAAMKAALIDEANAFAQSRGKVAVAIAGHEQTMRTGHLLTADYEFRLAAPGEPVATPAAAAPRPPGVAETQARPVVDAAPPARVPEAPPPVAAAPAAQAPPPLPPAADVKPSLYNELIMLDDLRKRGILTDAEFQALKTKLINGK